MSLVGGDNDYTNRSMYYKHLTKYFELFPKENIHIIFQEEMKKDPKNVIKNLYSFLEVDSTYSPPSLEKKVNPAVTARFGLLTKVFKLRAKLEQWGMGMLIDILKKLHLYDFVQNFYIKVNRKEFKYEPLSKEDRKKAMKFFASDINKLEQLLGNKITWWN
jgi:hypothetical protein